ncbi:hypothetical protein C8F04DRAFT_331065 [Mycena alexandri]|uniref:Uncharacterized protein n=1 Tax=Mycena alexandri TaxID=1745969 RepID=A0AAD6T3Z0_9AGAR|nr:hypothetical protein C8F04DRAFT_331065 [Mycena alexandri]
MPSFNLRPVSDASPSPSPTASGSPSDRSPAYKGPASPPPPPRSRRPLSPSSLRDVDLTHMPDMPPRRYPAPPTGHDLMAMFPPAAPDNFSEMMRPGPTSGYFQRQERAFFAQAGKEIVRVRVDVDLQPEPDHNNPKARGAAPHRPWPPATPGSAPGTATASPAQPPAQLYPHPRPTHARGPSVPATPVFPPAPHPHPHHAHPPPPPPSSVGRRTPAPDDRDTDGDYRPDDPDEAWRRPMPYNERRRAGKHTRRIVVRN